MAEKIYTIPVNEAFDACADTPSAGCPFCRMYDTLENNELDLILGASMMEPDVRIRTNELGFCSRHFGMMLTRKNRLGLALMLESHLDAIRAEGEPAGLQALIKDPSATMPQFLARLDESCYVCGRIDVSLRKMLENAAYLWGSDPAFREKTTHQPYFCLHHYGMWLNAARYELGKKKYPEFYKAVSSVVNRYFDELRGDVSHFCKKFDYRFDSEPWGNSKDSPERAIAFICGRG